jgi:UDP-N-acetylglucosamine 4,6-dehydratase
MSNMLKNKVILLTGGTGSFGNKFAEIVLKEYEPEAIRIFSRGEKKQLDMINKFNANRLRFFIGDVRDKDRLHRAMADVDIVVHAAALKQVPTCEYNPIEAVRTNVDGAINIIDTAIDNEVDRVIAVSTDKAVHPVNFYGATKMTAEKLFIQGNSYSGFVGTKFSCVRYGNVIGSRGSVIPLFQEQKKRGIITITDDKMTRFWITLEQGVRFVIDCIERMKGGEVFVPKIPSMKLVDLAEAIAPKAKKTIVGIRPGEKIHEILLTEDEARHGKEFDDYFVIEPEHPFWDSEQLKGGRKLTEGFKYTSDNNQQWLNKGDLMKIVKGLGCLEN